MQSQVLCYASSKVDGMFGLFATERLMNHFQYRYVFSEGHWSLGEGKLTDRFLEGKHSVIDRDRKRLDAYCRENESRTTMPKGHFSSKIGEKLATRAPTSTNFMSRPKSIQNLCNGIPTVIAPRVGHEE